MYKTAKYQFYINQLCLSLCGAVQKNVKNVYTLCSLAPSYRGFYRNGSASRMISVWHGRETFTEYKHYYWGQRFFAVPYRTEHILYTFLHLFVFNVQCIILSSRKIWCFGHFLPAKKHGGLLYFFFQRRTPTRMCTATKKCNVRKHRLYQVFSSFLYIYTSSLPPPPQDALKRPGCVLRELQF